MTAPRLRCRIHGPGQPAYVVCSHIVAGEPCADIEISVDDEGGEAVCERMHWDHELERPIGEPPTVMCEACAMVLVTKVRQ